MKRSFTCLIAMWMCISLGYSQIRILSVNPGTDEIAVKNFGSSMVDISAYRLCARFVYTTNMTDDVTTLSGSPMLQGGDTLVVTWPIDDVSSDVGLYLAAGSFGDSAAMVDFMQYGDAGIGREGVADTKGIWSAGDFLSGPAPYTYSGDGTEDGASFWAVAKEEPVALVRFLQVDPTMDAIWIKNFGDSEVDLSAYRLCSEFVYSTGIGVDVDVDIVAGSTTLMPGDTLQLGWLLTESAADLGLYLPEGLFSDTAAMVDFLQWGSGGNGREPVADSKGIWTAGEFITGEAPYTYTGDGISTGLSGWGAPEVEPEPGPAFVRIVQVDPTTDAIYIRNFGEDSVDISDYRLCSEFAYTGGLTSDVVLLSGSPMLGSGDTLGIAWPVSDLAADLGLYLPEGTFNDTAAMIDFLQWGGQGLGRESIADSKGIWTAGDFIEGFAPFTYIGTGAENGVEAWMVDSVATEDTMATGLDPALLQQISVKVFPSFVEDKAMLQIGLPIAGQVSISLLDGIGKSVLQESHAVVPGTHTYEMDLSGFTSGLYYVRFSLGRDLIRTAHVIKR